jgi:hypothetical protein
VLILAGDVSFAKYAWEGTVLYQAASLQQRVSFANLYLQMFDSVMETEWTRDTESLVSDLNHVSRILLWQYWIAMDIIINVTSIQRAELTVDILGFFPSRSNSIAFRYYERERHIRYLRTYP